MAALLTFKYHGEEQDDISDEGTAHKRPDSDQQLSLQVLLATTCHSLRTAIFTALWSHHNPQNCHTSSTYTISINQHSEVKLRDGDQTDMEWVTIFEP
jgi:hypothetical protein